MKTLYELLKPMEADLRMAYKHGGRISCGVFRDLEIYEEYQKCNAPKMVRYTYRSERYKVSESISRETIKRMCEVVKG